MIGACISNAKQCSLIMAMHSTTFQELLVAKTVMVIAAILLAGCGGGASTNSGGGGSISGGGSGSATPAAIGGKWEVISTSTQNPGSSFPHAGIEANFTQTDTTILSGNKAAAVIPFFVQGLNYQIAAGHACGGYQASVSGTLTGQSLSFTVTETGPSGTLPITGTATISSDNKSMSGNYMTQGGCGLSADSGTFTGSVIPSASGTYLASFDTGNTATLVLTEDATHNISVQGTLLGSSFTLSGETIGGALVVSGNVPGVGIANYVGFYLTAPLVSLVPTVNGISTKTGDFLIFGSDGSIGLAQKQ
jgi:hypothetical protein